MTHRRILTALSFAALLLVLAPPAFGGCAEYCAFMDCESYPDPEVGCIERTFGCLDVLCYAASPVACAAEAKSLELRIDEALDGVDLTDNAAVGEALEELDTPLRYVIEGEVIYQTPGFEELREQHKRDREQIDTTHDVADRD